MNVLVHRKHKIGQILNVRILANFFLKSSKFLLKKVKQFLITHSKVNWVGTPRGNEHQLRVFSNLNSHYSVNSFHIREMSLIDFLHGNF